MMVLLRVAYSFLLYPLIFKSFVMAFRKRFGKRRTGRRFGRRRGSFRKKSRSYFVSRGGIRM